MFKVYKSLIGINFEDFFMNSHSDEIYNSRGHQHRLQPPKYSGSLTRHNFFTNRIISTWNKLPKDLINSNSLQIFKSHLNNTDISSIKENILFPSGPLR